MDSERRVSTNVPIALGLTTVPQGSVASAKARVKFTD